MLFRVFLRMVNASFASALPFQMAFTELVSTTFFFS